MKNNLIIVCLLSSLSLPVCGQSTLDDCIRYAWEHNPGFKNIRIDVKEARTDYVAAMGKFLPHVSVQAEVGRHIGRSVDPDTNGYTADSYNQGTIGMDILFLYLKGLPGLIVCDIHIGLKKRRNGIIWQSKMIWLIR